MGRRFLVAAALGLVGVAVGVLVVAFRPDGRLALGLTLTVMYDNPIFDRDFPDPSVLASRSDSCCNHPKYAVLVARSHAVTGP